MLIYYRVVTKQILIDDKYKIKKTNYMVKNLKFRSKSK